jgi:hypothetical protein
LIELTFHVAMRTDATVASTEERQGRTVHGDASRPDLAEGMIRKTFTAMVEAVREPAIAAGSIQAEVFDAGIRDLPRTTEPDGAFCYTLFKGIGRKVRA